MKKSLQLLGLLAVVGLALMIGTGKIYARITGTPASGIQDDRWCVGTAATEVCVDVSGNVLPTTTGVATLGNSSLAWLSAQITTINTSKVIVTDVVSSRNHIPVILTTTTAISTTFAAAGDQFLVVDSIGNPFATCVTTAGVVDAIVFSSAPTKHCGVSY